MTEPRRQRILLVTRNLPPLVGGMERLNWHMVDELSRTADVRVVGPSGSAATISEDVAVREAGLRPLWQFLLRAWVLARREAQAWKPDIVLAGSGLTAPMARSAARSCGAKTCVYVHGLDVAVRHPVYRAIWLRAIRGADRVIANSHATAELCRHVGVTPASIAIVHPGVDLPAQDDGQIEKGAAQLRSAHHLGDRPLLLSVGRLSTRKGLREFVTHALPRIVAAQPDVLLVVVGGAPKQALHAEAQTPESIRAAAGAVGVAGHLRLLGKISDGELAALYGIADVHVFPIREIPGDPEGFGMVAVEAAAHGLPTVAFATGGVVDAVAEGRSGHLVRMGDYDALADAIVRVLTSRVGLAAECREFARQFGWNLFGEGVVRAIFAEGDVRQVSHPNYES